MTKVDLDALRAAWLLASMEGDMGLWWLADDVRELLGDETDEAEIRRLTRDAVRPLLVSGQLRAITLRRGGSFEAWPGDADAQLARIESEWQQLGRSPRIGDIVDFIAGPGFRPPGPGEIERARSLFGAQDGSEEGSAELPAWVLGPTANARSLPVTQAALDAARERWIRECTDDGARELWWLADDVRELLGGKTDEAEVRRLTLDAIRPLLASGQLRPAALREDGTFEPWPGDTDAQLDRIESEWEQLGRDPTVGDVGYFIPGPRAPGLRAV